MKIAALPNGKLLQFPDDHPDEEMDRAVRQHLGVPEEPEPMQLVMELAQQVLSSQQQIATVLEQNRQSYEACTQAIVQGQQQTMAALEAGLMALATAMTAPRVIQHDAAGRPVGVAFQTPQTDQQRG